MKTPLCFLAALAALFALPVDLTTMLSALFAAGLAVIAVDDYRRTRRVLLPATAGVRLPAHRFRLAA